LEGFGREGDRWVNQYVPLEIIHAAGMLPIQVTGDNEPVQMQGAEAHILSNTCSYIRTCWQLQLNGKYGFLDGLVSSCQCDQDKRLYSVWNITRSCPIWTSSTRRASATRKRSGCTSPISRTSGTAFPVRMRRTPDRDIANSIRVYNLGRELMHRLYELRKRERPPVTGPRHWEVSKAATRLPRERSTN